MSAQSFLAKNGLRLGALGSNADLAMAAPLAAGDPNPAAHTDASRIGWFFTRGGTPSVGEVVSGTTLRTIDASAELVYPRLLTVAAGAGTEAIKLEADAARVGLNIGQNNTWSDSVAGMGGVLIGRDIVASCASSGTSNLIIGKSLTKTGNYNNTVLVGMNVSVGAGSHANAIVIVNGGTATSCNDSIVIGRPDGTGASAVIIGRTANGGPNSVVIGHAAVATGSNGTALGKSATAAAFSYGCAIGSGATCTAANQIMLGRSNERVQIPGTEASTDSLTGALRVAGGVGIAGALVVRGGTADASANTIIGASTSAPVTQTVIIGDLAGALDATSARNVFIGYNAKSTGDSDDVVVIGANAYVGNANNGAVVIGASASAAASDAIALGRGTSATAIDTVALGRGASATAIDAVAIGRSASSTVAGIITLGANGAHIAVSVPMTTTANSSTTGALRVAGGVGLNENLYVTGYTNLGLASTIAVTNSNATNGVTVAGYRTDGLNGNVATLYGRGERTANGGTNIGVHGHVRATGGDGTCVGVDGLAQVTNGGGVGASSAIGVKAIASTATTTAGKISYGVLASAGATGGSNAATVYGGSFTATGAASSLIACGIYGSASGGLANYAGFFDLGVVQVSDSSAATNTATGALRVNGGIGVAGTSHIASTITNSTSFHVSAGTNNASDAGVHIDRGGLNGAGSAGGIVLAQSSVADRRLYLTGNDGTFSFNVGGYVNQTGILQLGTSMVGASTLVIGSASTRIVGSGATQVGAALTARVGSALTLTAAADTAGKDTYFTAESGGNHISNNPRGGDIVLTPGAAGAGGTGRAGEFRVVGDANVTGKLTVAGLIDPTGLAFTAVGANPGGALAASTLWYETTVNRFKLPSNTEIYETGIVSAKNMLMVNANSAQVFAVDSDGWTYQAGTLVVDIANGSGNDLFDIGYNGSTRLYGYQDGRLSFSTAFGLTSGNPQLIMSSYWADSATAVGHQINMTVNTPNASSVFAAYSHNSSEKFSVTLSGLVKGAGLQMNPLAANPGNAATLWVNSGDANKLYFGASAVGGGGGTPGGSNQQIQFNNAGAFGGIPNFEYGTYGSSPYINIGIATEVYKNSAEDQHAFVVSNINGYGNTGLFVNTSVESNTPTIGTVFGIKNHVTYDASSSDHSRTAFGIDTTMYVDESVGGNATAVHAKVYGNPTSYGCAIHGSAEGNAVNWAGYFAEGNVLVENLFITQGGRRSKIVQVGTNTTLTHTMQFVEQTADTITTDLWASPVEGDTINIRNKSGTGNTTIDGNGKNIDGSGTLALADGESVTLVYNGTEWTVF
jgi:hypothetical protein